METESVTASPEGTVFGSAPTFMENEPTAPENPAGGGGSWLEWMTMPFDSNALCDLLHAAAEELVGIREEIVERTDAPPSLDPFETGVFEGNGRNGKVAAGNGKKRVLHFYRQFLFAV